MSGPVVRAYRDRRPVLADDVYLAETAVVVGDVEIGAGSSVWFGAVVRGDTHSIRIGARVNIQDGAVVHVTRVTHPARIDDGATLGHHAVVHGATVERGALVGIGARVLDGAVVGEEAVVAAGALVPPGMAVPPRTLVVGIPARVRRPLTEEELAHNRETADVYVGLAADHRRAAAAQDPPTS